MKLLERKNTVFIAGALFIYVASFNSLYADGLKVGLTKKGSCTLKCKPNNLKNPKAGQRCVFVPAGCNKASKLDIPKPHLKQLINPKFVNPKRKLLPGDAFKPKLLPGDAFKPKLLPGDAFQPK